MKVLTNFQLSITRGCRIVEKTPKLLFGKKNMLKFYAPWVPCGVILIHASCYFFLTLPASSAWPEPPPLFPNLLSLAASDSLVALSISLPYCFSCSFVKHGGFVFVTAECGPVEATFTLDLVEASLFLDFLSLDFSFYTTWLSLFPRKK